MELEIEKRYCQSCGMPLDINQEELLGTMAAKRNVMNIVFTVIKMDDSNKYSAGIQRYLHHKYKIRNQPCASSPLPRAL